MFFRRATTLLLIIGIICQSNSLEGLAEEGVQSCRCYQCSMDGAGWYLAAYPTDGRPRTSRDPCEHCIEEWSRLFLQPNNYCTSYPTPLPKGLGSAACGPSCLQVRARIVMGAALAELTRNRNGCALNFGYLQKSEWWRFQLSYEMEYDWPWWEWFTGCVHGTDNGGRSPTLLSEYLRGISTLEEKLKKCLRYTIGNLKYDLKWCYPGTPYNTIWGPAGVYTMTEEQFANAKADLAYLTKHAERVPAVCRATESQLFQIFGALHQYCLQEHGLSPETLFEQGRLHYECGEFSRCLDCIESLISYLEKDEYYGSNSFIGQALNEAHLYNQAILVLNAAISNNRSNKESYFQRAIAYFELGNYEVSLADYLESSINPQNCDPQVVNSRLNWTHGMTEGLVIGGGQALCELGSTLWDLTQGSARALWAFTQDPIEASAKTYDKSTRAAIAVCHAAEDLFNYLSTHSVSEAASDTWQAVRHSIPELDTLIRDWAELDSYARGQKAGYIIGRYGVELLAINKVAQGAKYAKELKRANAIANFEALTKSAEGANSIVAAAAKHAAKAEGRFVGCKTIRSFNPYADVLGSRVKMRHLFEQTKHRLASLGSAEEVLDMVTDMVLTADRNGLIIAGESFEVTGLIKGKNVTARGTVIDGQLRYGTIFVPE